MDNFLKKIQGLPVERKKIILWSIVAVLALILFLFWFRGFKAKVEKLQSQTSIPVSFAVKK